MGCVGDCLMSVLLPKTVATDPKIVLGGIVDRAMKKRRLEWHAVSDRIGVDLIVSGGCIRAFRVGSLEAPLMSDILELLLEEIGLEGDEAIYARALLRAIRDEEKWPLIASACRDARLAACVSRDEMAVRLGVTPRYYLELELGLVDDDDVLLSPIVAIANNQAVHVSQMLDGSWRLSRARESLFADPLKVVEDSVAEMATKVEARTNVRLFKLIRPRLATEYRHRLSRLAADRKITVEAQEGELSLKWRSGVGFRFDEIDVARLIAGAKFDMRSGDRK